MRIKKILKFKKITYKLKKYFKNVIYVYVLLLYIGIKSQSNAHNQIIIQLSYIIQMDLYVISVMSSKVIRQSLPQVKLTTYTYNLNRIRI